MNKKNRHKIFANTQQERSNKHQGVSKRVIDQRNYEAHTISSMLFFSEPKFLIICISLVSFSLILDQWEKCAGF